MRRYVVASAAIALLCGCTSVRSWPSATTQRQLIASASPDAPPTELLARRVRLPDRVTVGIAWLNHATRSGSMMDELEGDAVLTRLAGEMRSLNIERTVVLPTTPNWLSSAPEAAVDTRALQNTAAQFQSDVLVVLMTAAEDYVDWNPLALFYVALAPALFIPGDDVAVRAGIEACAMDVRSGIFLGCTRGRGEAMRRFVVPIQRDRVLRDLQEEALDAALSGVADRIVADIQISPGRTLTFPPRPPGPTYPAAGG